MPISRIAGRRNVGVVDYDDTEEKKVSYYRECLQYGLQIPLKNPFDVAKDVFITIDSRKARRKARGRFANVFLT
jgi:hypothetical protein